jgi:hypothetical protein
MVNLEIFPFYSGCMVWNISINVGYVATRKAALFLIFELNSRRKNQKS